MYSGHELLDLWLNSKEHFGRKLSQRQLAKKLGLNFNSMHGKIFKAQKSEVTLTEQHVDMIAQGNNIEYTAKGPRITTLEQLIEQCEIDLDEWIVDRHVINKWEVGAKSHSKKIIITPLFQVKAWLIKKKPEAIEPVISAIKINIGKYETAEPRKMHHGRALILSDMHFGFRRDVKTGQLDPFHDRAALATVLSLVKHVNPDVIVIAGDILDLAEWSDKFIRSPDMYNTTQPAIVEASWFLSQIRKLSPEVNVYLLEGNHEGRLSRAINKQVPYAFGLTQPHNGLPVLSVPNLLGLDQLGITYVGEYPNGELWLADNLRAIHGDRIRAKSGATATAVLDDAQATTLFGHVHRCELASRTVFDIGGARTISAFTPGCLCRIDGAVPAAKGRNNWQQGVGVVDFNEQLVAITPVPIEQGVAMYGGEQYKGKSYLAQLRANTGWAF